jgi:hydroxyacylglutathione hydrolase
MIFERINSAGLAHNSYFVGSGNSAVVIDPRRDIQIYLDLALKHGMRIQYILETHRNEDYVIGSRELAEATQASICHGPWLDWKYGDTLKDGQAFRIGKISLTTIHTPGHTDEGTSYVLTDLGSGKSPVMVFTGDTLFVGDTGRVDLYGLAAIPHMASNLYDSVFNRLLPLGDGVILCPAHGAGSVCGTHIADRDESTLGLERLQNPALQYKDKDDFMRYKASERPERPPYFSRMEKYNLEGPPLLHGLPSPVPLTPAEFKNEMEKGAVVVDASWPAAFGGAHIKGSYSIWLDGLSNFSGWLLPYERPILLVLEDSNYLDEAVRYLVRTGYDQIPGFLKGGIEGWYNAGFTIESANLLTAGQLKEKLDRHEELYVLDVRRQDEWIAGHINGAVHVYVGYVQQRISEIPQDKPVAVICSTGHRSGIAVSILLQAGFSQVYNILGGFTAWRHAGYPIATERPTLINANSSKAQTAT